MFEQDKLSQYNIDDEEEVSIFDNRTRKVVIKNDPKIMIPLLTVYPGIKNYQWFSTSFCSIVQDGEKIQCTSEDYIESFASE